VKRVRNWTPWPDGIVFAKTFRVVLFPENGLQLSGAREANFAPSEGATETVLSPAVVAKPSKGFDRTGRI
jgi:hypothetical protein